MFDENNKDPDYQVALRLHKSLNGETAANSSQPDENLSDSNADWQLARRLMLDDIDHNHDTVHRPSQEESNKRKGYNASALTPAKSGYNDYLNQTQHMVHPEWELIDPSPDIYSMFMRFNQKFFQNKLGAVVVEWSKRMYNCAGICYMRSNSYTNEVIIRLSEPLLKLRTRKDLVETLLHEMIHAYLFILNVREGNGGHGPRFKAKMELINKVAGTNITVYHTFHDEVNAYRTHIWRCNGICQNHTPFQGWVKRCANRAPGPSDQWWEKHQRECGGTFMKISEPTKPPKPAKPPKDITNVKKSSKKALPTVPDYKNDIRQWFDKPPLAKKPFLDGEGKAQDSGSGSASGWGSGSVVGSASDSASDSAKGSGSGNVSGWGSGSAKGSVLGSAKGSVLGSALDSASDSAKGSGSGNVSGWGSDSAKGSGSGSAKGSVLGSALDSASDSAKGSGSGNVSGWGSGSVLGSASGSVRLTSPASPVARDIREIRLKMFESKTAANMAPPSGSGGRNLLQGEQWETYDEDIMVRDQPKFVVDLTDDDDDNQQAAPSAAKKPEHVFTRPRTGGLPKTKPSYPSDSDTSANSRKRRRDSNDDEAQKHSVYDVDDDDEQQQQLLIPMSSQERMVATKREVMEEESSIFSEEEITFIDGDFDDDEPNDPPTDPSIGPPTTSSCEIGHATLLKEFLNHNDVVPSGSKRDNDKNNDIVFCPVCFDNMKRSELSNHLDGCSITVRVMPPSYKHKAKSGKRSSSASRKPKLATSKSGAKEMLRGFGYTESDVANLNLSTSSDSSMLASEDELTPRQRRQHSLFKQTVGCPKCGQELLGHQLEAHRSVCPGLRRK